MTKPTEDELRAALAEYEDRSPHMMANDLLEALDALSEHDEGAADLANAIRTALNAYGVKIVTRHAFDTVWGPYEFDTTKHEERFRALDEVENRMRDAIKSADVEERNDGADARWGVA